MSWRKATLADFLGDNVVYRNLEPMAPGLGGLREVWAAIGLDHYYVPRKTAPEYAQALLHYLHQAQRQRGVRTPLRQVLFIGDTLMNDGTAARNVGRSLRLLGFIGADRLNQPAKVEIQGELMVANRWAALADFLRWVRSNDFPCDEGTALLVDLDKTFLGARGRNDKVIDAARVEAIRRTMRAALGGALDEAAFRAIYDPLNQPEYHPFTEDNQDYLAYITLMVLAAIYPVETFWQDLAAKKLTRMTEFVAHCEARRAEMPPALAATHDQVVRGLAAEDPTPFKDFRRVEYRETVARMDLLPDDAAEAQVLAEEIVLTAEVVSVARYLAGQGVLPFGISDKPDEASLPMPEDAARGYRPLHRTRMKVHGQDIV